MFKLQVNIDAKRANEAVQALRQAADELERKLLERMKEMHGKDWQEHWEAAGTRHLTLQTFPAMEMPLSFVGASQGEKQGNLPDFSIQTSISGGPIFYRILGVKPDGTEEPLCEGYPSRGYAFSSFSMYYDGRDAEGCTLQQNYIAMVLRDNDGREYHRKDFSAEATA